MDYKRLSNKGNEERDIALAGISFLDRFEVGDTGKVGNRKSESRHKHFSNTAHSDSVLQNMFISVPLTCCKNITCMLQIEPLLQEEGSRKLKDKCVSKFYKVLEDKIEQKSHEECPHMAELRRRNAIWEQNPTEREGLRSLVEDYMRIVMLQKYGF